MTTDVEKCRRILDTVKKTGNHITVTFNYRSVHILVLVELQLTSKAILGTQRYNPVHELVKRTLASGKIGNSKPSTSQRPTRLTDTMITS